MNGTLSTQSPSRAHRDPLKRVGRGVLVAIGITLFTPAYADAPDEAKRFITAKEYAALRLDNTEQYICLSMLYGKESAWNDKAQSGSHYGIPQGKSEYLKTANKYEQVDWGLAYIEARYGTPCAALRFFRENNYH
jgi:hypothetical protein